MLIYKLLGGSAEQEFARSWGVSYGMNAATEWKDVLTEAVKAAVILAIMERLFLTRNSSWLEEHVDYLSLQALMFQQQRAKLGFSGQVRLFFRHTRRLAE